MRSVRTRHVLAVALAGALLYTGTAVAGGKTLSTTLTPEAERPGPGHTGGSGSARITLNQGQNRVCFSVSWSHINPPTAAHIHEGATTEAGPVVVTLFGAQSSGTGTASGCVENVSAALIKDIRQNPEDYYVNVHDSDHPAGAIRGQLG